MGDPWVKMVQPMPYVAVQGMTDAGHPWGISEYAKMDYLRELPDEAIDAMAERAAEASSPFTKSTCVRSAAPSRAWTAARWRSASLTHHGCTSAWRSGKTPP